MLTERGVKVDHTTIFRWVQRYAPQMEKKLRWYYKRNHGLNWKVDETYIKVKGKWVYLYRAIDSRGHTIDFYLSTTRSKAAAQTFLGKCLRGERPDSLPEKINTDKNQAYGAALDSLKKKGKCPKDTEHRQLKYLNNAVESDHAKVKRIIRPMTGFKSMKTAYATIRGIEVMNMFRKGQLDIWKHGEGVMGEVRLVNKQFGIYSF